MTELPFVEKFKHKLTRREFLSYLSLGFVGMMLPADIVSGARWIGNQKQRKDLLGRVTQWGVRLYQSAHFDADVVDEMPLDSLWRITDMVVTDDETSANRIWYELNGKGYAHSRFVQPVKQHLNETDTIIPADGCLGEITMPFVDAYNSMKPGRRIAYRFYYASTFWVLQRLVDPELGVWYELLDDKYYRAFYVPAHAIRLVPAEELTPLSPNIPADDKLLLVDLATQILSAYEGDRVVFKSKISSGVRLREGGFATPKGQYRTIRKRPCRHMDNPANAYGSGFDLPGVPWVSYFTSDGVAFHGTYWHNDFGVPHSHGCINMPPQAAKWVYRWSTPSVPHDHYFYAGTNGTRVIVT